MRLFDLFESQRAISTQGIGEGMRRRYVVFGLTAVLAISLAAPAFGGVNPLATIASSVKSIATKALKDAKKAQSTANTALTDAKNAQTSANTAQSTASTALTNANNAQTSANTAQTAANKAQTTANTALTNANNAQTSANNAQTTANGKMSGENQQSGTEENATTTTTDASASCPSGQINTGGGYGLAGTDSDQVSVETNIPYGAGWIVIAHDIAGQTGTTWSLQAFVDCAVSP
jgi:alanyl-tRNA synthetase